MHHLSKAELTRRGTARLSRTGIRTVCARFVGDTDARSGHWDSLFSSCGLSGRFGLSTRFGRNLWRCLTLRGQLDSLLYPLLAHAPPSSAHHLSLQPHTEVVFASFARPLLSSILRQTTAYVTAPSFPFSQLSQGSTTPEGL